MLLALLAATLWPTLSRAYSLWRHERAPWDEVCATPNAPEAIAERPAASADPAHPPGH